MEFIADSGDEGDIHADDARDVNGRKMIASPMHRVYSDPEDDWTDALVQTATLQQMEQSPGQEGYFKDSSQRGKPLRKQTLTNGPKFTRSHHHHRRLCTTAVLKRSAAQDAEQSTGAITQHENEDDAFDWTIRACDPRVPSRLPVVDQRVGFVGLQPLPRSVQATQEKNPAEQANPTLDVRSRTGAPLEQNREYSCIPRAATAAQRGNGGSGQPDVLGHRTEDGLNVLVNTRKRSHEDTENRHDKKGRGAVNSGWGNNFVRIDLKKGRGSTKFRPSRHSNVRRRHGRGGRWKTPRLRQVGDGAEFMEGWEGRTTVCYRCGEKGHWVKDCPQAVAGLEEESDEGDDTQHNKTPLPLVYPVEQPLPAPPIVQIDASIDIEALCDPEALETSMKSAFTYHGFRGHQLETIQRVLRGTSCLSIMPTGMGKSLCYQLPTLLLPGLSVVVSPLIALMHDQCKAAPQVLNPAVLWSGQSLQEARQVLAEVQNGTIRLLFASPERMNNPHLLAALRPRMPLTLLVVDEAHCVAEWGHSFRPSYFRLGEVLRRDVSVRSILALTATATKATEAAVRSVLRIEKDQVLRDSAIRGNLRLHVEQSTGTQSARNWRDVLQLFSKGGPLASSKSAIVYCAWKSDANQLAKALVVAGLRARSYHAGLDHKERSAVGAAFAAGRLRVVVATVAFGMGIDIASVDAVVHVTMPRSLEEYVQQIGRAGRDGSTAQCYAFLSNDDFIALRSLAYSGWVPEDATRAIVSKIFSTADDCSETAGARHFGMIPCRKLASEIHMAEESMEAILGYLEAFEQPYLRVFPKTSLMAKVSFYSAAPEELVEEYPIVQSVLVACPKARNGLYSVPVAKLAEAAQTPPGLALQMLQVLAQRRIIGFEMSGDQGPAFEVLETPSDLNATVSNIHERLNAMVSCQVSRLDASYRALCAAASAGGQALQEAVLRKALDTYFAKEDERASKLAISPKNVKEQEISGSSSDVDLSELPLRQVGESMLQAATAALRRNREHAGPTLCPLTLARLLHGTGTSSMPRDQWNKRMGAFWGSLKDVDFVKLVQLCTVAVKQLAIRIDTT